MIEGRLSRPMAMTVPGMFLSQPGIATRPSYHCAPMIVSIESAIRSRDWSEKLMPSVPIEMPSETPTVLNRIATMSACSTPRFTWLPRSARCMLHGLPSYQTAPMPTCGLLRSSHESPVAISIACDAPWLAGWVMREEYLFNFCPAAGGVARSVVVAVVISLCVRANTFAAGNGPPEGRKVYHSHDQAAPARGQGLRKASRPVLATRRGEG